MSRFIEIGGSLNFRHLGDYETADGRRTRADSLYRGGWFELADAQDADRFAATGIRRIFDFRSEPERAKRPLGEGIRAQAEIVELEITPGRMGPYLQRLRDLPPAQVDCKAEMTQMHYEMLNQGIPRFRAFLHDLVERGGPAMIMCSTGKDRTGVASALLLTALGVPQSTVLADYLISADVYRGRELTFARNHGLEALGIDLNLVKDVFTVHPEYLGAVWQRIDEIVGSREAFLRDMMALSADDLQRLRDVYTH